MRTLTHDQQAAIDAYMDLHHPRVYPAPSRTRKAHWQDATTNTNLTDDGCSDRLDCGCARCDQLRALIVPQGFGNASAFRHAA